MKIRKAIKSDSAKDFSSLFFSNILQKLFGLVREPVTGYFFGTGFLFTTYLMLRTAANLFSQFTVGNALRANLLPKFTKVYNSYKLVSLGKVSSFSKTSMIFLFIISQLIQSTIILYIYMNSNSYDYVYILGSSFNPFVLLVIISILLSLSICFNFFNMIYLIIMQAQGNFFKYSIATTFNSFIAVLFIIPFSIFFNVLGLVISRLLGIITLTVSYILPMNKERDGYEVDMANKDINIPILVLGNFANIIIVSSQFVAGVGGGSGVDKNITYYYYAIFILNAVLTAVISNVSTLLLKKLSIGRNNKWIYYSLGLSIMIGFLMCIVLHFFSYEIIFFIYIGADYIISSLLNFVGYNIDSKFGVEQVLLTSQYLYELSYSFIFLFIATILFQPFFSLSNKKTKKERNLMSFIFLFVVLGGIFILSILSIDVKTKSLILIYASSFVSALLSIYSYYCYLKIHVKKG
jgi:peptidoglycan biosynthesis protein MviN/MurJ (putative lipid II flippase)